MLQAVGLLLLLAMVNSSCKDERLAEELQGTWKRNHVEAYEDGTKSLQEEFLTLVRTDSKKNGGTFTEASTGNEEIDDSEFIVKYKWTSHIDGTWEIKDGAFYQHYNIATLEVEVNKSDIDYQINKNTNLLLTSFDKLMAKSLYLEQNLQTDLQKDAYKALFQYYKKQNLQDVKGGGFSNIEVEGNTFSFETIDLGRVTYTKVSNPSSEASSSAIVNSPKEQEYDEDNDESFFRRQVSKWNDLHVPHGFEKSGNNPYTANVMLYGKRMTAKEAAELKQNFLVKNPDYQQECSNIRVTKVSGSRVRCDFDKRVTTKGQTKDYPSYLYFTKESEDNWLIDEESDEITDRNLRK